MLYVMILLCAVCALGFCVLYLMLCVMLYRAKQYADNIEATLADVRQKAPFPQTYTFSDMYNN